MHITQKEGISMGKRAPKERKIGMYKAILELKDLEECCNFLKISVQ